MRQGERGREQGKVCVCKGERERERGEGGIDAGSEKKREGGRDGVRVGCVDRTAARSDRAEGDSGEWRGPRPAG